MPDPNPKKKITFDFTSASGLTDRTITDVRRVLIDFEKGVIGVDYYSNGPHYNEAAISDLETTNGYVIANV